MGEIKVDAISIENIMRRLEGAAEELSINRARIDIGEINTDSIEEIIRIYGLYSDLIERYKNLLILDKNKIIKAKEELEYMDEKLCKNMMVK